MFGIRLRKKSENRNRYVFVGYLSAFQAKPFLVIHLMGKPVAVFRRSDGTLFSREMACTYDGADLTRGAIDSGVVTCPRHGHRFDLDTGECLSRSSPPLKEHAVRLKGYGVYVSLAPRPSGGDGGRSRDREGASERRLSDPL